MKLIYKRALLFCLVLIFAFATKSSFAIEAVASVKHLKGEVDIQRNNATIAARTGLILHDKDLVITYQKSKVTIIFRDGSVIRLFPNTKFLIEKSEEVDKGPRRFLHNFRLKLGSFWGKFTRDFQETVIHSPTATVGIKGTSVAMSQRDDILDVSLSTGKVEIANQTETVELLPGNIARNIKSQGSIREKIERLPYQVTIKPDQDRVEIASKDETKELYFTLQLIDVRTNKNASRPGEVYISSAMDNVVFDQDIRLNSRGYARAKAVIKTPEKTTNNVDMVEIFALMDGEDFLDTRAGSTVLALDYVDRDNQQLKIDARSGAIKR